jgi:hypothetical protein
VVRMRNWRIVCVGELCRMTDQIPVIGHGNYDVIMTFL